MRRVREVLFIAIGFAIGGWYSWRTLRRAARGEQPQVEAPQSEPSQGKSPPGEA
jgi:hypothetical protein